MCSSSERSGKLSAEVIVKVQEDSDLKNDELKTPKYPSDEIENPVVIKVRAEEILILVFVFILWISAIILFFNRWGKIRMLEPYQPLFMDTSQRPSCHISSVDNLIATRPRMSLSKYNVSCDIPSFSTIQNNRNVHYQSRNRLNSVFVNSNSNQSFDNYLPRRTKSAIDIHSIKLNEMFVLAKTKSSPIRIMNNTSETVLMTQRRRHSMVNSDRYSIGLKSKLANSQQQQQQQQKLPNFRPYRRPSASSSTSLANKRFPFRSFDQPSGHLYDYRRSSLLTSNICSTSTSAQTLTRSNFPTKKFLDRIKTLKSFDQPSFIIESPCENDTLNSVIVEVHDETTTNEPPTTIDSKKTDTFVVLANDRNKFEVRKFKRSSSCNDNNDNNDNNTDHKMYRKNRHSADDICQM